MGRRTNKHLKELYRDPKFPGAFTGVKSFYEALSKFKPKHSRSLNEIRKVLREFDPYTLHKPITRPELFRRTFTKRIGYLYQIDLCDLSKYANENDGQKYIITIIDTFSKKAWAYGLERKTGQAIYDVMEPFFDQNKCKYIQFDQGTEFYNKKFLDLLKRHNIKHYSTYSDRKSAIVERFNRTLKTRMFRAFTALGSHRWVDILPDLVAGYNNSNHRSIGMSPNEVTPANQHIVLKRLFPKVKKVSKHSKPYFKVGDTVRISPIKEEFQKGYEQTYSNQVYKVSKILKTYPITYKIKDFNNEELKGMFYKRELQHVNKTDRTYHINQILKERTRRGKKEYLVNWKSYPETLQEWIPQHNLFDIQKS